MHDITYAQEILDVCLKEAKGRKVARVKLELMEEGHLTERTLREAFKLISRGTIADGALLDIKPRSDYLEADAQEISHARILELELEER